MLDQDLNSLYQELAESIVGEQGPQVTPQDIQALAQMIQQIPQMIPRDNSAQFLAAMTGQIASMQQSIRELQRQIVELQDKEPNFSPVINEMRKTKTKSVVFEVEKDQWGFPERVIAKEKIQR